MSSQSKKDVIGDNIEELRKQALADTSVLVMNLLIELGHEFETDEGMAVFFKNRVKSIVHQGTTTLLLDGKEICAYKEPLFSYFGRGRKQIKIKTGFTRLI